MRSAAAASSADWARLARAISASTRSVTSFVQPMVPVANRPVMEHIARLLARNGFTEAIANLHWFPDLIRDRFGDATGQTPVLAGSGSTWFVPGAHPGEGRVVVRTVAAY